MSRSWKAKAVRAGLPYGLTVIFLVLSAAAAYYYFTFDKKTARAVSDTRSKIYGRLSSNWLKPDVKRMTSQIREGNLDVFDQMVLNAATTRWRMRGKAPHAFDNLMADYRRGWWDGEFVKDLAPALEAMDKRWISERQKALTAGGLIMPSAQKSVGVGIDLKFPRGTTTAGTGSLIEVAVTVELGSTPETAIRAFWATEQSPGITVSRSKICTFEQTKETSGGLPIYKIRMDMSDSPEWLYPETRPTLIYFRGTPPANWQPVAFGLKDSPALPVKSGSK